MTDEFEQRDVAPLTVTVDHERRRIIFHFHRIVDYDLDGENRYSEVMGRTFTELGPGYELIIDYTTFEPEHLTPERQTLFVTSATALKALGFERYIRVLPERLRSFFAPYEKLIAEAGVDVVTVENLAQASAWLDASGKRQ